MFKRFFHNEDGNFAIIFGLMLVPLLGLIGAAVDYAGISKSKAKIQSAADGALLAAAKDAQDSTQFYRLADTYLNANLGTIEVTSNAKADAQKVSYAITSRYETAFLAIIGMPYVDIQVNAEVAVNKFGSGTARYIQPNLSAVNNELEELERQLMRRVANLPPRKQEQARQRIKEQMELLRSHVSSGLPASQIYLKK